MKIFLLSLLSLFLFTTTICQNKTIDSLRHQLAIAKNDTIKLQILAGLVRENSFSNPSQALLFAQQELLLARKVKLKTAEAAALGDNGNVLSVLGDYSHSINFFLQSIKLGENLGFQGLINHLNLSEAYSDAGDYNNALIYAYKGKSITDTMNLKDSGKLFVKQVAFTYLGEVYEKFDKLDSAFAYLQKAREIDSIYFGKQYGFTTLHLANVYAKKNNIALALKCYEEVVVDSKIHNYQKDLMDAYNGIAKIFYKSTQPDSAVFYANQTLLLGKSTAYPLAILDAATLLSNIYKSKNNLDSTVKYMGLSILIKDSLFNREKTRAVQNISFDEQMRQQELQQALQQTQLKYGNRLKVYILLGVLLILLIVALGLWRRNIYKQKSFALLQKQKEQIQGTLIQLKSTQSHLFNPKRWLHWESSLQASHMKYKTL